MIITMLNKLVMRHSQAWFLLVLTLAALLDSVVPTPPQIIEHPEREYGFRQGSSALRLPCRARADPEPTYYWTKDGELLQYTGNIKREPAEGTIIILKPDKKHKGIYQCFAKNTYGVAVSTKSTIREAVIKPFPPSSPQPKVHRPEVGSPLTLRCDPPESYPEGDVYWSTGGDGGDDDKSSGNNRLDLNERVAMDYRGNLRIANVRYNDSMGPDMFYFCNIFNANVGGTMRGDSIAVIIEPSNSQGNLHFANVMVDDRISDSSYICIMSNRVIRGTVQSVDQKINPVQSSATPPFMAPKLVWMSDTPTVAIRGKDHNMKCIFSGFPTPEVSWSRVSGELPKSHRVSSDKLELRLNDVEWEDAGTYRCSAITPNMPNASPVYQDIDLTVESAPEFLGDLRDITRSVEEDAEFSCEASGVPKPVITWTIDGKELTETDDNPRRRVDGNTVHYTNLTKLDTEVLQCNASNKHGYAFKNVFLNVLAEPPSFIRAPESVTKVAEGQDVELACQVFGHPRPLVTWWYKESADHEEEQVVSGQDRMTIKEDTPSTYGGNLTIQHVRGDDEGMYKCKAWNRYGSIERLGRLVVREPTRITVHPTDKTVNASEDVELKCNAETDPLEANHLTITWTKDGEPIDYAKEPRISKNNQNHSLIITGASVEDTSEYTCVASNGLDNDKHTVQVTVKDRPDPPKNLKLSSCVSNVELMWEAGNANNEEIIEFIIYYNTSFDETGVYHKAKSVDRDTTDTKVKLSPWARYTFHVIARNRLGTSDMSNFTPGTCETPENIPYKNPNNVCTESREETQLVITWDRMEQIDHNGKGFYYLVSWRRLDVANSSPNSERVNDWKQNEYVVLGQDTFQKYEISVQANNNQGSAPANKLKKIVGYSGEGKPRDSPNNFAFDEDSLNATSVVFTWDPVDSSPDNIQGHFIGYEVVYWRVDQPEERRSHEVILDEAVHCEPIEAPRRGRRQASSAEPSAHVLDLWPYSTIAAGVSVRNSKSSGELSPTIEFSTPEGVPGILPMFEVRERGSHHLGVVWAPPIEPNGVILGYMLRWSKLSDPTVSEEKRVDDPFKRNTKIKGLTDSTEYRLTIAAETIAGYGTEFVTESSTLVAGSPDVPGFADVDVGDTSVNVSWIPTDEEHTPKNPGSEFFVEYRKKDSDEDWTRVDPMDDDQHWANVSGLDFGDEYEFVIVAVNGAGDTTRSEIKTVVVGSEPVTLFPTTADYNGTLVEEPQVMSIARAGWFVGMMCAIAFLLLVLIIVCLIKRNRGGKYPVHEKEKLRGRDPDRDDEERGFGEYTKTDEPDYTKSAGSLESESKPLGESDTDSMAEYEDTDPCKFNEDGSFIGQYGGKKKSKDKIEPDATSPSALSTFV